MTPGSAPLFETGSLEQPIVNGWRGNLTRADLLRDAAALAGVLPRGGEFVNLCEGRYNFLVGFVAVLLRGGRSILPGDPGKAELNALARADLRPCLLTDREMACTQFERIQLDFDGSSAAAKPPVPEIRLDRPVVRVFSSGSTGTPTGVTRTWRWLLAGAHHYLSALGIAGLHDAHMVATVPSQHSYGLETAIMLPLRHDVSIYGAMPFYPADVASALAAGPRPRILVTTPFHLRVLLESGVALPRTDLVVSATAPLPTPLAQAAETSMEATVREVYGCTEVGLVATRRTLREELWTLPPGLNLERGESGARVMADHLPEPTTLADEIEPDGKRRFRLLGRGDDIVKIAGKRASLAALNQVLAETDGVADGVFFLPPGDGTAVARRLMAFVVAPDRSAGELRKDLRERIPAPFLPRPLVRVSEIPRTANGKVRYNDLVELSKRTVDRND